MNALAGLRCEAALRRAASIALAALTIATVSCGSLAASPSRMYLSDRWGYQISLPEPWRLSTRLSLVNGPEDYPKLGHEAFTARSVANEEAVIAQFPEQLGPAWQYVVVVEAWANPQRLSALQWAATPILAGWASGQQVESVSFAGVNAARTTNGPRFSVVYYVPRGNQMLLVGYKIDTLDPSWQPAGTSQALLASIVDSFQPR